MDLSQVPHLELRQKIKPLSDKLYEFDDRIEAIREKHRTAMDAELAPIEAERDKIDEQLAEMLDGREIIGICSASGLPVFEDDEYRESDEITLACLANGKG